MPRKSKVQKKLMKEVSNDYLQSNCPYNLELPSNNDLTNNFSTISEKDNDFLKGSYTPVSGINVLSDVSNGVVKRSRKRKRSNSSVIKRIKITDKIIQETPVSSLGSGSKTFYCSQNLYESAIKCDPNIMQNILPSVPMNTSCYTETKISQATTCSPIDHSKTQSGLAGADDSKTVSGFAVSADDNQLSRSAYAFSQTDIFSDNAKNLENNDGSIQRQGYIMSQLYNSPKLTNQQIEPASVQNQEYLMTQLYDSHSFIIQQSSSNVQYQNLVSDFKNLTQSTQSNSYIVNTPKNESNPYKADPHSPYNNNQQDFSIGQTTPIKWSDMTEVRKKLTFNTLAEMYRKDVFGGEDDSSDESKTNDITQEKNSSPWMSAVSAADVSMINNPPTKFHMQTVPNSVFNQQKLCKEHLNPGFHETNDFSSSHFESQSIFDSFPTTPEDMNPLILPPSLLLSNYCSEYDKAYTVKDLKPNQYRNYRHNESLRSLKEHLDSIIPPHMSLKDIYNIKNLP